MASPGTQSGTIRFGPFELDPANRELRKRGTVVKLQPQQFAVLLLLVERAGQIVSREEIHQHIWGIDTFVDFERGINFAINQIRSALGDDAEKPRFVETIPRYGYRFVCPIEVSQAAPVQTEANAGPMGGTVAQASAAAENPATGDTKEKTNQLSKGPRWKSRKWLLSGFSVAVLLILAVCFLGGHYEGLRLHLPPHVKAKTVSGYGHMIVLTNVRGVVSNPVFSPDGKQIAFLWNGNDQNKDDIYVQLIGGGQPLRVTYSGIRPICCLNWSSDGQWISFRRCEGDVGGVFIVPLLGGPERRLTEVTCMGFGLVNPAWTLDGKSLLLGDRCLSDGPYGIVVFSLATGRKHCLTAPSSNNVIDSDFKLSPDGKMVAFVQFTTASACEIYVVPLEGGTARQLTSDGNRIGDIMWAADGKRIIFTSHRGGQLSDRLWQISIEGGEIEPETVYPHLGVLSRDGQRVAYVIAAGGEPPTVWRAELSGPGGQVLARKKVVASPIGDDSPQLSPDETKIAFASPRSGSLEIWRSDADGSNPLQLTSFEGELDGTPRWSPDGKWIVFDRRPGKYSQIYVIDAEGRNLHAITDGEYENCVPSFSRDGQSIYFGSMRSGNWQLWKQRLAGGGAVQITHNGGFTAFESYDGKTLYYTKKDGEGIWSIPLSGGAETLVTAAPRREYWGHWAVCETGLYVMDDNLPRSAIEFYNFKTRKLKLAIQLEHTPYARVPGLDASRDCRIVLFVQYQEQTALAMVENFQ